ncbi:hypothetical protein OG455_10105 [Kitasatospora sp. NBC_01287]|uniref:lantibiotic dehydratase C-terminal domain-containing protein n=1 Tax=Kitasatospora sp. NBC_01287 TaxID=2903573 RepID=UPI00224F8A47|nr:lantibiotic dehydratase C-terminal domain-containing protein [Kitasatospora sp. NBC_01287]MCX4745874.1 hypothetical protein [Kitasatospora sp. NBC_01287]
MPDSAVEARDEAADARHPVADDTAARDVVVYYREPVKAALLRTAVLPLAERWAAQGLAVHVERHWLHGPHLRLRLEGPPDQVVAAAGQGARELRDRLAEHPSQTDLTDRQLLDQAVEAGRAELIAPPYGPIVPDNTVRIEPVDRGPLRSLIGADGTALRDDLLRLGRPALRAGADFLGAHGDSQQARLQLAVTALAAHAGAFPTGLAGGHWSFLSHLEDFLLHSDPDGRLRAAFEARWERAGDTVTELVGRVAGDSSNSRGGNSDAGGTGWEQPWAHWSATAWQLTADRLAAGADLRGFPLEYRERAAATGDAAVLERWDRDLRTRYSEFHRLLRRSDPEGRMFTQPDYLTYRACTNVLYRLLAVCDVLPLERYLAAYLLVRAVPALTGVDWRQQVQEVIDLQERAS